MSSLFPLSLDVQNSVQEFRKYYIDYSKVLKKYVIFCYLNAKFPIYKHDLDVHNTIS